MNCLGLTVQTFLGMVIENTAQNLGRGKNKTSRHNYLDYLTNKLKS